MNREWFNSIKLLQGHSSWNVLSTHPSKHQHKSVQSKANKYNNNMSITHCQNRRSETARAIHIAGVRSCPSKQVMGTSPVTPAKLVLSNRCKRSKQKFSIQNIVLTCSIDFCVCKLGQSTVQRSCLDPPWLAGCNTTNGHSGSDTQATLLTGID